MNLDPTKLCQIEIHVRDLEESLAFYEKVFGWNKSFAEMHEYTVLNVPENCPFGISLIPGGKPITQCNLILYFNVCDIKSVLDLCPKYNGKILFGPKHTPGVGELYQICDPNGQKYGLKHIFRTQPKS